MRSGRFTKVLIFIIVPHKEIQDLRQFYSNLIHSQETEIQELKSTEEYMTKALFEVRNNLQGDLLLDSKKIKFLSWFADITKNEISKILNKGESIIFIMKSCQKFETEREKVSKWLPVYRNAEDSEKEDPKKSAKEKPHTRPKTSVPKISCKSAKSDLSVSTIISTPESKRISTIHDVKLEKKKSSEEKELELKIEDIEELIEKAEEKEELEELDIEDDDDVLKNTFECLKNLNNFWTTYNKVNIDYMELKQEKRLLNKENKELRGMIRSILEAAVLNQSVPNTKVSTRVQSKRSGAYSAPMRRVIF